MKLSTPENELKFCGETSETLIEIEYILYDFDKLLKDPNFIESRTNLVV